MFELLTIGLLANGQVNPESINIFCADVVGIPYASDNFTDDEWSRFVYCRESLRLPSE